MTDLLYPRLGTPRDPTWETFGGQVAKVSEQLGFPLFPWQRHIVDVALEYRLGPDGRPIMHYREVRLWVPRQSGKTILMLALLAWRCLFMADTLGKKQNVKFFSTTGQHAKQKWQDEHVPYLEKSLLNGKFHVRKNNGHEAILWDNDSIWSLGASTEKAGHGDSLDLVIADEFFAQDDDRIEEGARPTMITREGPQIWFVSTFGSADPKKEHKSAPLWTKVDDSRERCRTGEHGSVASFEYSAADYDDPKGIEIDYGSRELWLRTMPGLAENGGTPFYNLDSVGSEFEGMKLHAFKRAYLNLRQPRGVARVPALIAAKDWDAICDKRSTHRRSQKLALGLDVEHDDARASIVVAGPGRLKRVPDDMQVGYTHLELVDDQEGSDWLTQRVAELLMRHEIKDVALDAGGPASRFLPELEIICKRLRVTLHKYNGKAYQAACEAFRVAVADATIRNHGQPTLAAAVDQGVKRVVSDLWVWDRRTPMGYISPLIAATAALRAVQEDAARGPRRSAYEDWDE